MSGRGSRTSVGRIVMQDEHHAVHKSPCAAVLVDRLRAGWPAVGGGAMRRAQLLLMIVPPHFQGRLCSTNVPPWKTLASREAVPSIVPGSEAIDRRLPAPTP